MKAKKLLSLLLVFVLAVSLVSTAFAAGTEKTFSDVDSTHWAKDYIDRLVAAGAADGYPDGTFKPSQYITRVEFMKLLNGVCGFTEKSDDVKKFTDVQAPWKVEQVAIALAAGYTTGTSAATMSPDASITREMAVTMIGRAAKLDPKAADLSVLAKYSDAEKISAYAEGFMAELTAKDLLAGYPDGTVRPQGLLTRAEAAKLLCGCMDLVVPETEPTEAPVIEPTAEPTAEPTTAPTAEPSVEPTAAPTAEPTAEPTVAPTQRPLPPAEEGSDDEEEPEDEFVYVLMNIPYADFYAAENAVDSISSATLNGKARNENVNGASYHQSEAAVTEEGIAGVIFPVLADAADLAAYKEIEDDDVVSYEMNVRGTMTPFTLEGPDALAENPDYSYYVLDEEPAGYKVMTVTGSKASFGPVVGDASEVTGADGEVTYMARHANLEIKTSGIEVAAADVSAVVVTADSGSYALHHVVNIWRGTELGWNDADLDLYGQTITNFRYYLKDGTVTDYPVNIKLEDAPVYVLMNIPYADFYAAENAVDSISSATLNGKARNVNVNGASYHQSEAAVTEEGIAGVIFPVKALPSALEGFQEVTDADVISYELSARGQTSTVTLEGADALAENPSYSYYKLVEEPAGYKALTVTDGKASFGRLTGAANVVDGAEGTVAYAAHHADLEISTSGIEVAAGDVSAVVITTDSGAKYALHHVVNIWRGTEIGWNDSDLDLYGQTLTNLRFYLKDGTVNDYPVSITLKTKADGVSVSFADEKTVAVSGLPADAANAVATVKSVVGRGETPAVLAENVPVVDGKVALNDSAVSGTNYQITIVSDNYADVAATLGYNVGK